MKIVIIEDEELTAEDLASAILKTDKTIEITAILGSVRESVAYFRESKEIGRASCRERV